MSSPYIYIQDETTWQACLPQLQAAPRLAIDLESNSMYAYRESICLIQISTPEQDFIIDPLAEVDIAPLEDMLLNTAVEKIFHAAEYDLILLQNERGWAVNNIFDTMWAARILGYERIGLANMLNLLFGVELDKRFQRTDWGRRPLRLGELAYAQGDTHHLFALRDYLAAQLHEKGHWAEAQEIFQEQSIIPSRDHSFDPEGFWNFAAIKELTPQQRAILKELYLLRDELALRDGLPVFKVIHNEALVALTLELPASLPELYLVRGLSRRQIQRDGHRILQAMARGQRATPPRRPKPAPRPTEQVLTRYDKLQRWRKERGLQRGVESEVIASRDSLWRLANQPPQNMTELAQLNVFGPFRLQTYGAELVALLRE